MKTLKKLKNKKGFTLIELLTVIAILGILVLIAAPKFLGYTAKANVAHIKADVKTYETRLAVDELENKNLSKDWTIVAPENVDKYISEKSLYDEYGLVKDPTKIEGEVKLLDKKDVDVETNLKGDFLYANGEIYYHDETLTMGNDKNDSVNDNDEDDNTVVDNNDKDDNTGVDEPEFTSEDNFTWISNTDGYVTKEHPTELGYYQYTGTGEEIVNIPHVIEGTEMKSYFLMFVKTGENVKKVISTNPNVTDMKLMFYLSKATTLDLSSFNTSNVTDMSGMFKESQATTLDLSKFNTSKVTTMQAMFFASPAKSLDLSSFDTSKVTDMNSMFYASQATTVYARSQADANRFNKSGFKPSNLTFSTK